MDKDKLNQISSAIRDIPDFPKEGIIFKDITTLLNDASLFALSNDYLQELVKDYSFDAVVGIESRGFENQVNYLLKSYRRNMLLNMEPIGLKYMPML